MAFLFPMIMNFLSYSTSCATYSRKSENGGLVTTISACFSPVLYFPMLAVASAFFGTAMHRGGQSLGLIYAVFVAVIFEPNCAFAVVGAEQVGFLIFIACGNEFFQPQVFKIVTEIFKEIANAGVVAVT